MKKMKKKKILNLFSYLFCSGCVDHAEAKQATRTTRYLIMVMFSLENIVLFNEIYLFSLSRIVQQGGEAVRNRNMCSVSALASIYIL